MAYSAKISSKNPMAFVIMVDQSGSMSELISWNGIQISKAEAVSEIINNLINELVARARSENHYKHYYDVMVLGYSGKGVSSLFADSGSYFHTPEQLNGTIRRVQTVQHQRQLPDGRMGINNVIRKIWVEVGADGRTPMREAFSKVTHELKSWCAEHPDSFPPIVINITDGEATDASGEQLIHVVTALKSLSTNDGQTLLMNIHLSTSSDKSILFPTHSGELPDDRYALLLHEMSSIMPAPFAREIAQFHEHDTPHKYCAIAFNASMQDLVRFLEIGSTTINNM